MTQKPPSAERKSGEIELKIYINLKKQSQFSKGQNDVKSILTIVYGDFGG
jgi:hypothetical protein